MFWQEQGQRDGGVRDREIFMVYKQVGKAFIHHHIQVIRLHVVWYTLQSKGYHSLLPSLITKDVSEDEQ